ncbi:hypothetical protein LBMAG49_31460 [Planctomycetota bacterium]|nr:hypothetical protein LBMAG49_31460 [Planctomycetota bacterium]
MANKTTRPRLPRRHLLALCTFLVPLGALAWLQQQELLRQDNQFRGALQREASQFLVGAAQEIDHQFDSMLPVLAKAAALLLTSDDVNTEASAESLLPDAARRLQREHTAVRDLLLLDPRGGLRSPEPAITRNLPPLARDVDAREPIGRNETSPHAALRCAELLIDTENLPAAEALLRNTLLQVATANGASRPRRGVSDGIEVELRIGFRLATVLLRNGKRDEALAWAQRVRDQAESLRELVRRGLDSETEAIGVLAETLLAESVPEPAPRLDLLTAISAGHRDATNEAVLRIVAQRLSDGISATATERAHADDLLQRLEIHLAARSFAAEYESYLDESVQLQLHNQVENGPGSSKLIYRIYTLDGQTSLLLLQPLLQTTGANSGWVGIRLDLEQLLVGVLEGYVRGNGRFVLAVSDSEDHVVIDSPKAPAGFDPPVMLSHTLQLRAHPANVDGWVDEARAAANASFWLVISLLCAAAIGAYLLWRSVSRESELATLKVELVSRVSHELKTPLALIALYGETLSLKRARDADQAADFGRIITRESGRLTTLIQRILDFSQQQAGTQRYELRRDDLTALLIETATAYQPHLAAKGCHLQVDLQPNVFAMVDARGLAGAVINLLDNAVKYATDGQAVGELQLVMRANKDTATIELLDQGRGVKAAERDRIFESFYRGSNAGEVRGAGLGLSIVRHFATAHGGTATVLPRDGIGSAFRITLQTTP